MWDFSFTEKPCVLFCPDLDDYIQNRGVYTAPEKWGFPISRSNEELSDEIKCFDTKLYSESVKKNHECFGSYESGTATEKICKIIMEELSK